MIEDGDNRESKDELGDSDTSAELRDDSLERESGADQPENGGQSYDIATEDVVQACPDCGAEMPESDQVICLRCGHDARSKSEPMRQDGAEQTTLAESANKKTTSSSPASRDDTPPDAEPLCPSGGASSFAARIATAIAGIVMIVAYLIGVDGLYADLPPANTEGEPPNVFAMRMLATLQYVIRIAFSLAIIVGVLKFCTWFMKRPAGRWSELLMRSLTVAVVTSLAMLTSIALPWLEYVTQIAIALLLFFVQLLLLFRMSPKEAGYATAGFAILHGLIVLVSPLISWIYWQ